LLLLAACAASLILAGCHRKPAKTAADLTPPPPPVESPAPVPEPEPVPAAPAPAPDPDPLSGDLDSVNDYLRRNGLLGDAYFDYDRAELSEAARDQLSKNARFLLDHPVFTLSLEGHCDERGTAEYNLALGERRAQAAKGYMLSLGVPGSRVHTISYGKERPVCTEAEEPCLGQNRRAHPVVAGRD
jgi:peptidoglycan-associated lipoprotein